MGLHIAVILRHHNSVEIDESGY